MNTGNVAWVLISAALVLFMTPGLAFFYGGMVRSRNVLNMLMMNFWCLLVIPVLWVAIGYSLSFSGSGSFLGDAVRGMLDTMGRESIVGALKGVPWDKRDEAAARGTDVHDLAERIIHGEEVEVPEHLAGYVQGYVDWLDAWDITVHATEMVVGRRPNDGIPGYAGTFDADGTFERGHLAGKRGLLDWKTSKGVYGENALQLAAYQHADFYLDDDGAEQPMPTYDFLGVVHITPTGTDLYVVEDPAASWRIFRHVAYVATQTDAIKSQISEPTPTPQGALA